MIWNYFTNCGHCVIDTAYVFPDVVRLDTIPDMVTQMIGYNLKTKQTPPDGVTVNKVRKCTYTGFAA